MNINMGMGLGIDSSMKALAINNYLTHINTLWAWIAFVTTAALSFWKFKSTFYYYNNIHSHHHRHALRLSPPPHDQPPHTISSEPEPEPELEPEPEPKPLSPSTTISSTSTSSSTFCWLENRKSGKFRVYYGQDEAKDDEDNIIASTAVVGGRSHIHLEEDQDHEAERRRRKARKSIIIRSCDGWELITPEVLKTGGEMDWYRHQDLSVLHGNVVRLWN